MKNNVTIRIMGNFEQNTQQNDSASIPMIRIQLDGGSGSGNWGHVGRPGKIGGSGKGGGAQNRLQTPSGGFTSRAQAEKENRQGGKNSKGPGSAGGNEISRPKTPLTKEQGMKRMKSITSKMGDISTYTERFIPADPNWPDGKYSGAFFEVLGYNNLPKVVSEKEFDQIKSPFPIQYRGVKSGQQVQDFMFGKRYVGGGANGAGTNTTSNTRVADRYAKGSNLLVMKLSNDARVIKDTELKEYVGAYINNTEFSGSKGILQYVSSDPGAIAASLGYDAIEDTGAGWLNVMNRLKLVVKQNGGQVNG